ncbi:MAG: restriction endonuclease subunit S [Paludibacteraceae bacterium]|nr:restriction endonuclease subunit S [Paludibacteraceae bacterium]
MELIKYKLSDVAKVEISGVDKKTKEGEMSVKLCNFTDVYHNWTITKNLENSFMQASANANEIRRFSIKKGQVAFTKDSEKRDDIGIATYIADDFDNVILGYHCALITPDDSKVSGAYINAFMQTYLIKKYFSDNASGSGQRYTLTIDTMNNMPLFLPSLPEQKRIASILSALDNKIALNRQINQNLLVHSSVIATIHHAA